MKKVCFIYLTMVLGVFAGCTQDDFLEKYPLTGVSPETFFKKGSDFKIYVNQFYDYLGDWTGYSIGPYAYDNGTDNQVTVVHDSHLNGETIVDVVDKQWDGTYSNIRDLNVMLAADLKGGNWDEIKPYMAEGHFFRAWLYFNLVQRFGDVVWLNKPLQPNDKEDLMLPRLPRNAVIDSIVADLDFAIKYLPGKQNAEQFRLYKEVALAFKSRVCLYEGTWEKYHGKENDPFRVQGSDGSKFIQMALDAAQQVINGGLFDIEKKGSEPYFELFNKDDYTSNKEIILWRKSDRELRAQNVSGTIRGNGQNIGLTKDLIDSYLCLDGKPISLTSFEIVDDSLTALIENRDPRLAQTIYYPGIPAIIVDQTGEVQEYFTYVDLTTCRTGYHFRKGANPLRSNQPANQDQTAYVYFRYAEVLLNFIEAKAELTEMGKATLSQNDFDISINKLRNRVDMPQFNYSVPIIDPIDAFTGELPWYLVEIRRERRIELAVEGYRMNDIFRWAAADELIKGRIFRGAKFKWYVDRKWFTSGQIKHVDNEGLLSPWHNTFIANQGGYAFNLNRDYLYPIPSQEIILANYTQNPGWE